VTARLIISTSGFGTGNMLLRYRWFDGERWMQKGDNICSNACAGDFYLESDWANDA
jgi:hypothetical protein